MDLVPSIFSTMTDGGRGHFLVDPFNVERNLREVALDTGYFCTHVFMYPCIHVLMYLCTHVFMYLCNHVPMYLCTPLSVEPDLCEVAIGAWPAEQRAAFFRIAVDVTGNSDDDVLISDT